MAKFGPALLPLPPPLRGTANPKAIAWLDCTPRTASPPAYPNADVTFNISCSAQLAGQLVDARPGGEGRLGARAIHQPLSPAEAAEAGAGAGAGAANAANVEEWGAVRRYPPGTTAGAVGDSKGRRLLVGLCSVMGGPTPPTRKAKKNSFGPKRKFQPEKWHPQNMENSGERYPKVRHNGRLGGQNPLSGSIIQSFWAILKCFCARLAFF